MEAAPATSESRPQPQTEKSDNSGAKDEISCDVLVIGAGFSGLKAIYEFRKKGLHVKAFEAASELGGVWHWNRYPGARVDSEAPLYQLNIPEVYKDWHFSERYPGGEEIRRYLAHVDKTLRLSQDIQFNARVIESTYSTTAGRWTVKTDAGDVAICKYLVLCTGLLHKTFTPDIPGLDSFKGELCHSASWPENVSAKGKRVAVIGSGATAVQIIQELGKEADSLSMFVRRPTQCMPMKQRNISEEESRGWKTYLNALFQQGRQSSTGFPHMRPEKSLFDVSEEERNEWFEYSWAAGGIRYVACNYGDIWVNEKASKLAYDFWAEKMRARLTDPAKQAIMIPAEADYLFGTKRVPLEHDYYEVLNQDNVEIVDLRKTPLESLEPTGILTADKKLREFDMVVFATGFDSYTGSITRMGLKSKDGVDIEEVWKDGIYSYFGLMASGFPNVFMVYGPQSPAPFSNGTTIIECQVDWVADSIAKLEAENAKSLEPLRDAEVAWKQTMSIYLNMTLFGRTDSWWNRSNIPCKKADVMMFAGGIEAYEKLIRKARDDGWEGLVAVPQLEAKA